MTEKITFPVVLRLTAKRTRPMGETWYKAAVWDTHRQPPTSAVTPTLSAAHLQLIGNKYILWGKP